MNARRRQRAIFFVVLSVAFAIFMAGAIGRYMTAPVAIQFDGREISVDPAWRLGLWPSLFTRVDYFALQLREGNEIGKAFLVFYEGDLFYGNVKDANSMIADCEKSHENCLSYFRNTPSELMCFFVKEKEQNGDINSYALWIDSVRKVSVYYYGTGKSPDIPIARQLRIVFPKDDPRSKANECFDPKRWWPGKSEDVTAR